MRNVCKQFGLNLILLILRIINFPFSDYICQEWKDKKNTEFELDGWRFECAKVVISFIILLPVKVVVLCCDDDDSDSDW